MFALFLPNFPTCTIRGTLCFVILFQKFQIANISFSKISYLFALPLHVFMSTRPVLLNGIFFPIVNRTNSYSFWIIKISINSYSFLANILYIA